MAALYIRVDADLKSLGEQFRAAERNDKALRLTLDLTPEQFKQAARDTLRIGEMEQSAAEAAEARRVLGEVQVWLERFQQRDEAQRAEIEKLKTQPPMAAGPSVVINVPPEAIKVNAVVPDGAVRVTNVLPPAQREVITIERDDKGLIERAVKRPAGAPA